MKLMKQNDESLLGFHKDLAHVAKAQSVTLDTLLSEIKDLQRELQAVYDAAKEDADQLGGERRAISLQELKEQITLVRCVADVKHCKYWMQAFVWSYS